jgi:hypothetical protein
LTKKLNVKCFGNEGNEKWKKDHQKFGTDG